MSDEPITPDAIMQLGFGYWGSRTLLSAVELGVFTALGDGALDASALGERLGLHPRSRRDFLDALVALGMLEREAGRYANTPAAAQFLDRRKPGYVGGLLEMSAARLYRNWDSLSASLRSGRCLNDSQEGDPFEDLYESPEALEQFVSAMTGVSLGAGIAAAQAFPWKDYASFIDVGCAQGGFTAQIALAHPHLRGGGFDLPQVGPVFERYMASHGLGERMRFHPGNFFEDPLPGAEVIVMGRVLHDWDLEQKRLLIAKAHAALPPGGAFVVYEALIDDERRQNALGLLMSLNMLLETPGGFDFTGADCQDWMREAGFGATQVVPLAGPDAMVIGIR